MALYLSYGKQNSYVHFSQGGVAVSATDNVIHGTSIAHGRVDAISDERV